MDLDDFKDILSIKTIEEKIFKIKNMYHPNLIANLSKEAYDLYLMRMSICDQLLKVLNEKDMDFDKIKDYIKEQIAKSKERLSKVKDKIEIDSLKVLIEEWDQFL